MQTGKTAKITPRPFVLGIGVARPCPAFRSAVEMWKTVIIPGIECAHAGAVSAEATISECEC